MHTFASEQAIIETAFANCNDITPETVSLPVAQAIAAVLAALNKGTLRVADKKNGTWQVHEWVKKAALLSFRITKNDLLDDGINRYFDKVPTKFNQWTQTDFTEAGIRVVPGAVVREGAFIAKNTVLMPSFINIGAYVDEGTMVDTWVTVGSCAQIGKNVHLSGGVGIGGVLEPLQASPTIIEDNCFIGARSEVVEGVIVEEHSVLSMGVFIGQSTKIYDRSSGEISYGRIPAGSVVIPGSLPSKDGRYNLNCAVIVKKVDEKTRGKVGINELLRGI